MQKLLLSLAILLLVSACKVNEPLNVNTNENILPAGIVYPPLDFPFNTTASLEPSLSQGSADSYQIKTGVLPPGLSLNPTTGEISGTVATISLNDTINQEVTIEACNRSGCTESNFLFPISLLVSPLQDNPIHNFSGDFEMFGEHELVTVSFHGIDIRPVAAGRNTEFWDNVFARDIPIGIYTHPMIIAAESADVDGDTKQDLVAIDMNGGSFLHFFRSSGGGTNLDYIQTLSSALSFSRNTFIRIMDIDGTNGPDIVIVSFESTLNIETWRNDGAGDFLPDPVRPVIKPNMSNFTRLTDADEIYFLFNDLDSDGMIDIAFCAPAQDVSFYVMPGISLTTGGVQPSSPIPSSSCTAGFNNGLVFDYDNNTTNDLMAVTGDFLLIKDMTTSIDYPFNLSVLAGQTIGSLICITIIDYDYNEDGLVDLVFLDDNNIIHRLKNESTTTPVYTYDGQIQIWEITEQYFPPSFMKFSGVNNSIFTYHGLGISTAQGFKVLELKH